MLFGYKSVECVYVRALFPTHVAHVYTHTYAPYTVLRSIKHVKEIGTFF